MVKVYIIILNWNGLTDTLECLDSVYMLDYPNFEVIVVDNCSSDDSVEAIRREFPRAVLIENSKNLGYTGGNNIGIRHALELGADYVWLLNNDTVVDSDTLTKLVNEAEQSPETGLVSPVIYYYHSPEKVQYIGAYLDFTDYTVVSLKEPKELDSECVQRNLLLYGTALFLKKSVIESVGYLSEKYFAYQEDFDYSLRARKKNFRALVRLDARVLHKDSRSTSGKCSHIKVFFMTRNVYFLWRDNMKGFKRIFMAGHYLAAMINYMEYLSDEGDDVNMNACLSGVWAAFNGKGGDYDPTSVPPSWFRTVLVFLVSWHPYFWTTLFRGNFMGIIRGALAKAQIK